MMYPSSLGWSAWWEVQWFTPLSKPVLVILPTSCPTSRRVCKTLHRVWTSCPLPPPSHMHYFWVGLTRNVWRWRWNWFVTFCMLESAGISGDAMADAPM
jgi:hypothetical protein